MKLDWFPALLFLFVVIVVMLEIRSGDRSRAAALSRFEAFRAAEPADTEWRGEGKYQIPTWTDSGRLIAYGRELIAHTSLYLGPAGTVASFCNGMNCQNCHLDAGTVPYANNFGKVSSGYPQFRPRANRMQTIIGRIDDCMRRSMNGRAMDSTSREMRAMLAYFEWLGAGVPKGASPGGTVMPALPYSDSAALPAAGAVVYASKCSSCHGARGQGSLNAEGTEFIYPPLWGPQSYNDGAGLYRLTAFAVFVKENMPFGTDYHHPALTDEEAWNLAAFVNSQPRPHFDQQNDWPDAAKKPVDCPIGPYVDPFPERQHKFGPFGPIEAYKKRVRKSG